MLGADMNRLTKDAAAPDVNAGIEESEKLAKSLQVNGTPTYVIGGRCRRRRRGLRRFASQGRQYQKMRESGLFVNLSIDVASFLKVVPAVIGIAGLLTYFMRPRKPVSEQELVNMVRRVRNLYVVLGCAALILLSVWLIYRPPPPDRDTAPATLSDAGKTWHA